MALALHKEEREVVEAIIWFVNLKRIRSTKQIENRFQKLGFVKTKIKDIETENVKAYRYDQAELRDWMQSIIKSQRGKKEIMEKVIERLDQVGGIKLVFKKDRLEYEFTLNGVQAVCALGLAFILDENRGLTTRLQQCGNLDCNKFRLDFKPKGRPRRFCNEKCKRPFDNYTAAERVRKHRAKMKSI